MRRISARANRANILPQLCVLAVVPVLLSCSFDAKPPPPADLGDAEILDTTLSGLVWRDGPIIETAVVVRDAQGLITQGRTDASGRFEIQVGPIGGTVELAADRLRQRVNIQRVGDAIRDVLLSPIGTLAEAYADSPVPRTRDEKLEIVAAFFQVPLTGTALSVLAQRLGDSCADFENTTVGPSALAGLLQGGFRYLGEAMLSTGTAAAAPDDVLDALVRDVSADGFLDGIGPEGQPLHFAGVALDPFTMRSAYINAMTSFLRSSRNQSGFDATCFKHYFDELLLARSALFPASTWINAPFKTGCASCTQLPDGDFACTTDDCGPCGRCRVDYSGAAPTAACEPSPDQCPGNCGRCEAAADAADHFLCIPDAAACGGDCSVCAEDPAGHFVCSGDIALCPKPTDGADRCNRCQQTAEREFRCEDRRDLCPAFTESLVSPCGNARNFCAFEGVESFEQIDWTCQQGTCQSVTTTVDRPCSRATEGIDCGALECRSPWSACHRIDERTCSTAGRETRRCRQPTCSGGRCSAGRLIDQDRRCTFDPRGQPCDERVCDLGGRPGLQLICCSPLLPSECSDTCGSCIE